MEPLRIGAPKGVLWKMDKRLLSASGRMRLIVILLTFMFILTVRVWYIPEEYLDLGGFNRGDEFGEDYIADNYTGKVVRNDPTDIYTKEKVDLNEREDALWEKEECSPYPPLGVFVIGGLHLIGDITGLDLFGATILLELIFVVMVMIYCLRTRWYLFPLIMLNVFSPFRVYVTGGTTNLFLLVMMLSALFAARHRKSFAHYIQAAAIAFKFMPFFYISNIFRMKRKQAFIFSGMVIAGLVLPVFLFDNYLYIYSFHATRGYSFATSLFDHFDIAMSDTIAIVLTWTVPVFVAALFTMILYYIENRLNFDWEERIGWSAVPFGLFLGWRLLSTRFFFLMLLLPDKRGTRTFMVFLLSMVQMTMFFADIRPFIEHAVWDISAMIILSFFVYHLLKSIGWKRVRQDLGSPFRTFRELLFVKPVPDLGP
ncbi:MAG: hypothetical protein ACMUHB_01575 [Thermoplasmatota archaeon]